MSLRRNDGKKFRPKRILVLRARGVTPTPGVYATLAIWAEDLHGRVGEAVVYQGVQVDAGLLRAARQPVVLVGGQRRDVDAAVGIEGRERHAVVEGGVLDGCVLDERCDR